MKRTYTTKFKIPGYFNLLLLAILLAYLPAVQAQSVYKITSGSSIKVVGTSNLHDWDMTANSFTCEGNFVLSGSELKDISALSFILPVKNLTGKEDLLTTRAHKALKAEQFDKITFKLLDVVIVQQQKLIKASGNLTISGVTRKIAIQSSYVVHTDGSIAIKGSKPLKMSEFNIKAPSFMMGALKTGDDITIEWLLKLKK